MRITGISLAAVVCTEPMTDIPDIDAMEILDSVLVASAQDGEMAAFDELLRRYHGKIYGLVYNMTSNAEDTEDMLQEIFLAAHRALPKFHGKSSFYTWIYRIAVNRTLNFLKKRARRRTLSLNDEDLAVERDPGYIELSARNGPVRDASITELQKRLNEALQKLSNNHRSAVVLHDIEGRPHEEIAEILSCSVGTVRSRLHYARRQLQVELKDYVS